MQQAYASLQHANAASTPLAGLVLSNIEFHAQKEGRYDAAQRAYAQAFSLIRYEKGEHSSEHAKLLKNSALLNLETGHYQEALEQNSRALAIENDLPSVKPSDKALTLNNLGLVLATLQRFGAAEKVYIQALNLRKGPSLNSDQARTLNNLANLEKEENRWEAARQHALQALELAESTQPVERTLTASILNSMGMIALPRNKLPEAKTNFEKAAALWIETVGREHPSYAATLSNRYPRDSLGPSQKGATDV